MTPEEAAEALAAAVQSEQGGTPEPAPAPSEPVNAPPAPAPQAPAAQPEASEGTPESLVDPFTGIDLADVPEELRGQLQERLHEIQADYTRKTQEASPIRQVMEATGISDPEEARAALAWYSAIQSDPNAAFQFYNQLGQTLDQYGMPVGQPPQGEPQGQQPNYEHESPYAGEDMGLDDLDPNNPLVQIVGSLAEWQEQIERERLEAQIERQLTAQEQAIRQQHPDWTDAEMDRVAQLAFSYGGDLTQAASDYDAWRTDTIAQYVQNKASVRVPTDLPGGGAGGQTPLQTSDFMTDRGEVDMSKLNRAALLRLAAEEAEDLGG